MAGVVSARVGEYETGAASKCGESCGHRVAAMQEVRFVLQVVLVGSRSARCLQKNRLHLMSGYMMYFTADPGCPYGTIFRRPSAVPASHYRQHFSTIDSRDATRVEKGQETEGSKEEPRTANRYGQH